jgi:hypothetical protein
MRCATCDAELIDGSCPFLAEQWHASSDEADLDDFMLTDDFEDIR